MGDQFLQSAVPPAVRSANRRLGLTLLSIAIAFFVGIVIKRWLFS